MQGGSWEGAHPRLQNLGRWQWARWWSLTTLRRGSRTETSGDWSREGCQCPFTIPSGGPSLLKPSERDNQPRAQRFSRCSTVHTWESPAFPTPQWDPEPTRAGCYFNGNLRFQTPPDHPLRRSDPRFSQPWGHRAGRRVPTRLSCASQVWRSGTPARTRLHKCLQAARVRL